LIHGAGLAFAVAIEQFAFGGGGVLGIVKGRFKLVSASGIGSTPGHRGGGSKHKQTNQQDNFAHSLLSAASGKYLNPCIDSQIETVISQCFLMDTLRLKYFSAVAESGSVRRAAEILHVSAPSLSKAVSHLEAEIGVKLFIRSGRNIRLTDAGKRFADKTKDLLKSLEELRHSVEEEKNPALSVKIATFEVFSTYFLSFLDQAGWEDVSLTVHDVLPGELERALVERQVDVGVTYMPVAHPELDFLKVAAIEMGVFAAKPSDERIYDALRNEGGRVRAWIHPPPHRMPRQPRPND
jgi:hypothetical protein